MTFPHWSRVTLYTSSCEFAECCVFVKQSHGPVYCASRHCPGGPLLPKLRGYVAEFLNEVSLARLGIFCTLPPVSVLVRPACRCRDAFLGSVGAWPCSRRTGNSVRAFRHVQGVTVDPRHCPSPTSRLNPPCRCRNVGLLSIGCAFRPGLRCRLTPGGRTLPGKPWDSGGRDSHPAFRYSCPHNRWLEVHRRSRARLRPVQPRSPTVPPLGRGPRIRSQVSLPIIFGAGSLE